MKNVTETLPFFEFEDGISRPKSVFNLPKVKFHFDLSGSVYVAVRKNDILTDLTLLSTKKRADFLLYGSALDKYIDAIIRNANFWTFAPITFADYFHQDNDLEISLTFEKVSRKLEHGDFDRIFIPFDWVFQFVWVVSRDYYINPRSLAGAIRKSIKWDKASNTITVSLSGYDAIFVANFLVTRMFSILREMQSYYDREIIIKGASFMLFELFNISPDSGDSAKVNQWLHQD